MNEIKVACDNNSHKVLIYSLSTCVPCKAAEQFLREANIEFKHIDVDLCDKKDLEKILKDIRNRGGNLSLNQIAYPKIIIDDKIMITGFDKEKIRETLMREN